MIPKIIHYCWFGKNPLPELAKKCINSWKKYCPDYKIVEWNEDNFNINYNRYTKEAYAARKWAFVSDVARLYALVNVGGIYMDTDVEVIKPIDDLLQYEAISGFESVDRIPTGLMGAEKGQILFKELLEEYDEIAFIKEDGALDTTTNVVRITNTCKKYGLSLDNTFQTIRGLTLLPYDYLCPKDSVTKEVNITKNTYVIHHFDGSWLSEEEKYAIKLRDKYKKYMPPTITRLFAKFIAIKRFRRLKEAIKEVISWGKRRR